MHAAARLGIRAGRLPSCIPLQDNTFDIGFIFGDGADTIKSASGLDHTMMTSLVKYLALEKRAALALLILAFWRFGVLAFGVRFSRDPRHGGHLTLRVECPARLLFALIFLTSLRVGQPLLLNHVVRSTGFDTTQHGDSAEHILVQPSAIADVHSTG